MLGSTHRKLRSGLLLVGTVGVGSVLAVGQDISPPAVPEAVPNAANQLPAAPDAGPAVPPSTPKPPLAQPQLPNAQPSPRPDPSQPLPAAAPRADSNTAKRPADKEGADASQKPAEDGAAPRRSRRAGNEPAPSRPAESRSAAEGRSRSTDARRPDGPRARDRQGFGIQLETRSGGTLVVNQVQEGSIAAQAGLQAGDRIVSVDGRPMTNPGELQAYLRGHSGRPVPVIVERGDQRYTISIASDRAENDGAWLGVYLQDGQQGGARITSVYPSGPAARAGLRPGDVILQVDGQRIASTPDLIATMDGLEPHSRVDFVVLRDGRELTVATVLGSRENFVYYERDSDESDYEESYDGEDDGYSHVPPFAMQLEHDRRMAEQHQRIEMELRKLQDEIRELREALNQRR